MIRDAMIYVIDDDESILYFINHVLHQDGYRVQNFSTGEKFLDSNICGDISCVITDLWLPGIKGDEIQKELLRRGSHVPLIAISSSPDVPTVVRMMKHGAVTVLQKPLSVGELLSTVEQAVDQNRIRQAKVIQREKIRHGLSLLSEGELKVMSYLMNGVSHKAISSALDLSLRTVDRYRKNVLEKMRLPTLPQLIAAIAESGHELEKGVGGLAKAGGL